MIAKRISSKAKTSRIARLVKYVVAAEGGLDPRSWSRTADYVLCSKTNNRGEKVGGVRVTNCHTDDPAAATSLIEATQAANTRSKTDKTYHLVFSFPPGEQPDIKVLHAIEDQLCAAIGYADHQRISAVHIDTDHLHVHVAINKVHPTGFQNIEPYFDKKKLMETCERLELEYGLQRTNHGLDGREPKGKVKPKQAQAEAHSGVETLTGYMAREVTPLLLNAKSWNELHSTLADHGLTIKKRGNGLVIGSGETWVKASQCDRSLSLKSLTDKLGPFDKPAEKPAKAFEPKPMQRHPSSAVLFEQYQRERELHAKVRERGLEQIKYESAALEYNLKKWRVAQKLLAKVAAKGPKRRAMLKVVRLQTAISRKNNRKAIEAKRNALIASTATPTWAGWLTYQAEHENVEALAVLLQRRRQERETMRGNFLTTENPGISNAIMSALKPHVDKNGTVIYNTTDGGVVVDRKTHVQSLRTTEKAALLSLELAQKRFNGQALIVEGSDQFKADVARLAGTYGVQVRFADAGIELRRQAMALSKIPAQKRGKESEL